MIFIDPAELRAKLATPAGQDAFDKLNALGPQWTYNEQKGRAAVSVTIEKKVSGYLSSTGVGFKETVDDAVLDQLNTLRKMGRERHAVLVVNAYESDRAQYLYDPRTDHFVPEADNNRHMKPDAIRAKLITAEGRAAFDELDALKPDWATDEIAGNGEVYLSPSMALHGRDVYISPAAGLASSFDAAAIGQLRAIKEIAREKGLPLIVNGQDGRRAYKYDNAQDKFLPF